MKSIRGGGPVASGNQTIPWGQLWDVVVVGAGPAGAMAALELGRTGKRVLLLERQAFPRWKVCGATLSPGVVGLLGKAGLEGLLPEWGATPLHTVRLGGWSMQAEIPLRGSTAISRQALDAALVREAVGQGANFCPGARVRLGSLLQDRRILEVTASGGQMEVSTRAVVAADGLGSGLMTQAGVPSLVPLNRKRRMVGLGGVFSPSFPGFDPGVIHMALGEAGYVGVVRVEGGHLNIASALDSGALKNAESPAGLVNSILGGAGWPTLSGEPDVGWKGTPELTRRPQRPGAERLFAVGDAGGYVEPFTGEGVLWALSGARALSPLVARVAERWDPGLLERWGQVHSTMVGRAQRICWSISWALARPTLSKNVLRVLKTYPRLAEPVVKRVGSPIFSSA